MDDLDISNKIGQLVVVVVRCNHLGIMKGKKKIIPQQDFGDLVIKYFYQEKGKKEEA